MKNKFPSKLYHKVYIKKDLSKKSKDELKHEGYCLLNLLAAKEELDAFAKLMKGIKK